MKENLTESNFLLYAAKRYDNPQLSSSEEFFDDLERIRYIKKSISRYEEIKELNCRLLLNHIIVLHNCFGGYLAKILFLKLEKQFCYIKPFLVMLNIMPDIILWVNGVPKTFTEKIVMDENIINMLRKINNE